MLPEIRIATTADGDIEAAIYSFVPPLRHVIVNPRTGNVIVSTVSQTSDEFRWLVREARRHCAR